MTVAVDICNSALLRLGQERITSLADTNARAVICDEQYPKTRDRVLTNDIWSFSIVRDELTASGASLAWGDGSVFDLPLDCVRLVTVLNPDLVKIRYSIENRKLIANEETLYIRYVSNTAAEANYDPYFSEALALMLAADMCYKFTNSTTLSQELKQEAERLIANAMSKNAQEFGPEEWDFNTFNNARRIGVPGVGSDDDYYIGL
jgi:hypothetical protein